MAKPDAPVETTLQDALHESEWILHDCVDALLRKTGVHPKEVRNPSMMTCGLSRPLYESCTSPGVELGTAEADGLNAPHLQVEAAR